MSNNNGPTQIFNTKDIPKTKGGRITPETLAEAIKQGKRISSVGDSTGILNTNVPEKKYNYVYSQADLKLGTDHGGAQIIFGRDRPSSEPSGYGGAGAQNANTIDIVVGRAANTSLKDGSFVGPLFASDASRIYISQMTDVDVNFGLAAGRSGTLEGRSAVGIKADGVRVIGKHGVKIVTGRSFAFKNLGPDGEKDSLGLSIPNPAPPIELIAGNNDGVRSVLDPVRGGTWDVKTLQGVAMGENTRDCVDELSELLEEFIGLMTSFVTTQTVYNSINGVDPVRSWISGQAPVTSSDYLGKILNSLYQLRVKKNAWSINYTQWYGSKYIPSRNVFST